MGSLATFGDIISTEFNIPIRVISLVSTLHVLVANRKIQLGLSLDDIYNDVKSINENSDIKLTIDIPKTKYKPLSIITTCLTGEGSSVAMKNFLINSLTFDENIIDILTLDCINKDTFDSNINKISTNSKILFIISSFNLDTNFNVINFSDVFKNLDYIQKKIDINSMLLNIKSTLSKTIKNLDCNILYDNILKFISSVEKKSNLLLDTDKLICLTLQFVI